jgi:hypothetical protein
MSITINAVQIPLAKKLIFLSLYLVFFASIGEVYALIAGTLINHLEVLTPILVKLGKDLAMWSAIVYFFTRKRDYPSYSVVQVAWWGLILLVTLAMGLTILNGRSVILLAAGLRWVGPIFLFISAIGLIDKSDIEFIARIVSRLFVVHFILQIVELFVAAPYYGLAPWGLNLRNPGLFLIPNTGGLFTVLAALFCLAFQIGSCGFKSKLIYFVSAVLTASGTAVVTLLVVYFVHYAYKSRRIWIVFSPLGLALIFWLLSWSMSDMRGDDYVALSLGTRLEIISSQMSNSDLVSAEFGTATNTAVMLEEDFSRIVDSTYASVLANFGWFGFLIMVTAIFYALYISEKTENSGMFVLICYSLLVAFTTILNEAYPFNFVLPILFAYYFSMQSTKQK